MKSPAAATVIAVLFLGVGCTTSSKSREDAPSAVVETRSSPGLQAVTIQALGME